MTRIVGTLPACGMLAPPDARLPIDELVLEPRARLGTLADAPDVARAEDGTELGRLVFGTWP